jgi:CMP-N-acetylneuraminic acid synthetase
MITYGACLISKDDMLEFGNVVTESPTFVELDEVEAVDIDTELDFKFAEFLYTQGL